MNEGFNFKIQCGLGGMGGVKKLQQTLANEEFKMVEGDEDQIDLLNEKELSKDLSEFYQTGNTIEDLKNQLRMNVPGLKNCMPGVPVLDHH